MERGLAARWRLWCRLADVEVRDLWDVEVAWRVLALVLAITITVLDSERGFAD